MTDTDQMDFTSASSAIVVPSEGRSPTTTSDALVGMDGNAFVILGRSVQLLRQGGASPEYVAEYKRQAQSRDYDHLLAVTIAFLDAKPGEER